MQLPDLSHINIEFTADHAVAIALGALGCSVAIGLLLAWKNWGYPLWGKYMDSRKREREHLELMATNQIGALEYMISEGQMTPQDMWKLAPKYDNIPGFRYKLRDMLKKYLPEKREVPKSQLSELDMQPAK